jgi:hypothetical protein
VAPVPPVAPVGPVAPVPPIAVTTIELTLPQLPPPLLMLYISNHINIKESVLK